MPCFATYQVQIVQPANTNLATERYMSSKKNIIQYPNQYELKNFWKMNLVQDIIVLVKK